MRLRFRVLSAVTAFALALAVSPSPALAATETGARTGDLSWEWQHPTPQGEWVEDVALFSPTSVLMLAGAGVIMRSTDGGTEWSSSESGTRDPLYSIACTGTADAWAVGEGGSIVHSSDGGQSWTAQSSGVDVTLGDVYFVDSSRGWASGEDGKVLRTTNGGASWAAAVAPGGAIVTSVFFLDAVTGWCADDAGQIFKSIDGGATWVEKPSGTTESLYDIRFASATDGVAVGYGIIRRTTNGGASWTAASVTGRDAEDEYGAVRYLSATTAVAAGSVYEDFEGYVGLCLRTVDGGLTWSREKCGTGLWCVDARGATALLGGQDGTLVRTTDSGATFALASTSLTGGGSIRKIDFVSDSEGWAIASGGTTPGIVHTADAGDTWGFQMTRALNFDDTDFVDIAMADASHGIAVGETMDGDVAWFTKNGSDWEQSLLYTEDGVSAVSVLDQNRAWIVLWTGAVLATTDGGDNWTDVGDMGAGSEVYAFTDIDFVDATHGFASGVDQWGNGGIVVFATSDGGATWVPKPTNVQSYDVNGLEFVDASNGYLLTPDCVLRTTDGGATWVSSHLYDPELGGPLTPSALSATDTANVWVAASGSMSGSVIFRSVDGGAHWASERNSGMPELATIEVVAPDAMWVGGWSGAILHASGDDHRAPISRDDAFPSYAVTATVHLSAEDAISGVEMLHATLDGASDDDGTIQTTQEGAHALVYGATDHAGNVEPSHELTFSVLPRATTVGRVEGRDRYVVAVNVAKKAFPGWVGVRDVIIASGEDPAMADPLSAAGLAGVYNAPILLVNRFAVPSSVSSAIAAMPPGVRVHIVGGTAWVPSKIANALDAIKTVTSVKRTSAANRYGVAAAIAEEMEVVTGRVPDTVLIANGADSTKFYDALALAPVAARMHYPILMVSRDAVPKETAAALADIRYARGVRPNVVVGGNKSSVSDTTMKRVSCTKRLSGTDRVGTAVAIAEYASATKQGWTHFAETGVANKLPDALTGGATMGLRGGVLLYTSATGLSSGTGSLIAARKGEIGTLDVFGGTASVSEAVRAAIRVKMQ